MITDLRLQNFRSYSDSSFEIGPGVNIVVGPNGSGKTNLLESVLVLARGNSYRAKDSELIHFNKPWLRIDAHLSDNTTRTVKIEVDKKPPKSFEVEEKKYLRLSLEKTLPVVLFEPDHLRLLTGGPERRRDYLDNLLEQTIPTYGRLRRDYRRTLAQRNALLKRDGQLKHKREQIFPWNVRLSELGGQMAAQRMRLVDQIDSDVKELYGLLSSSKDITRLSYLTNLSKDNYESHLLKKLDNDLEKDTLRGFTGSGPHREDLEVNFNSHPAQVVASRGESRTIILALKILELRLIEEARGITPLLLLDDVFSELDGKRRHMLTDYLNNHQTFITTTDADAVIKRLSSKCSVIALTEPQ